MKSKFPLIRALGNVARNRRQARRSVALLLAIGVVATPIVLDVPPAVAATKEFGFQGGSGDGSGWEGITLVNGQRFVCIDPAGLFPAGASMPVGLISNIPGTSRAANPNHNGTATVTDPVVFAKLNMGLSKYLPLANSNVTGAAIELFVYSYTSSLHPGDGVAYYNNIRVTNAANRAAVWAQFKAIQADVNAHWADPVVTPTATTRIVMNAGSSFTGTVTVSVSPASASGVLHLTGAVVSGTASATVPVGNGSVINVTGTPQAGARSYQISAMADGFRASTRYAPNVTMATTGAPAAQLQRVISAGTMNATSFASAVDMTAALALRFEPIVSTKLQYTYVNAGDPMPDNYIASVTEGSAPWMKDANGTYDRIVSRVTHYGPFASKPSESASVPAGAPVFSTATTTLTGPGDGVDPSLTARRSGWYTTVNVIDAENQSPAVRLDIPADYHWSSSYGEESETGAARAIITATSKVTEASTGLFVKTGDVLTVIHDDATGPWPAGPDGTPMPVTFLGTEYWVPGDAAIVASAMAPVGAEPIATASVTVTGPGDAPRSDGASPPAHIDGHTVWQWRLEQTDLVQGWTENFGEASQTTQILAPRMVTSADVETALGDPSSDAAIITGPRLGIPATLTWKAYLQKQGTGDACTPENQVFDSAGDPVSVTRAGTYRPANPPTLALGTVNWVASLTAADGSIIQRGTCGDPTEVTRVVDFAISTTATPSTSGVGHDVAHVVGPTPKGSSVVFSAYGITDGRPVCDASTLKFITKPVPLNGAGDYRSEDKAIPSGGVYWVETVLDATGAPIPGKSGICGDASEITHRATPSTALASTGTDSTHVLGLALGLLGFGAMILSIIVLRRMLQPGHPASREPNARR
jgi:hypothetical protein